MANNNLLLVFGIVSFLLFFTYFTTGVLYSNQTSVRGNTLIPEDNDMPIEFEAWVNIEMQNFLDWMHNEYSGGFMIAPDDIYCFNYFFLDRNNILDRFDFTESGIQYYYWCVDNKPVNANNMQLSYNQYLSIEFDLQAEFDETTGDFEKWEKWQGNLIRQAIDFLSLIPNGILTLYDIATFNIEVPTTDLNGNVIGSEQAIPQDVKNILFIFLIPLWIIMAICIFLVIPDFLTGIGNLIPFT